MKAAIIDTYGPPDVIRIADVDRPQQSPDEVLVQVRASAVTQGDRRMRAADFPGFLAIIGRLATGIRRPRNAIPGTNFAGVVVATGENVSRFK